MERYDVWGGILIIAALISLALQVHHWRRGRLTTAQFAAGSLARAAFLFLGIIYATDLVARWPRLPIAGLFIVGIGIFLNMAVNVLHRHRRTAHDEVP